MSQFSGGSALEPMVQFRSGFEVNDRTGKYKAPATAQDEGTVVKLSSDGETLEVAGSNDGQFILEQPCALASPIGNADNREEYLQGIPQKAVECGTEITVYPIKSGGIISTSVVATGSETGAMLAASITPGTTEFESYGGVWRILQGANTPVGMILSDPDDDGMIDLLIY